MVEFTVAKVEAYALVNGIVAIVNKHNSLCFMPAGETSVGLGNKFGLGS